MNNKSSLSLIGSIVLGSLVRSLKIKGSSSTVNPKDLPSEIDISFTMSFPWTDSVSIEDVESFIDHIRQTSNNFRLGLNVSDVDYAIFLDCIINNEEYPDNPVEENYNHEFHWELCEKVNNIALADHLDEPENLNELWPSVNKSKKLFHYVKDLHVKYTWPSLRDGWIENKISLEVFMTVGFCDYDTMTEISESLSDLTGQFGFRQFPNEYNFRVSPVKIDPSGKLSEKVKHLIYGTKSKSELRRF